MARSERYPSTAQSKGSGWQYHFPRDLDGCLTCSTKLVASFSPPPPPSLAEDISTRHKLMYGLQGHTSRAALHMHVSQYSPMKDCKSTRRRSWLKLVPSGLLGFCPCKTKLVSEKLVDHSWAQQPSPPRAFLPSHQTARVLEVRAIASV